MIGLCLNARSCWARPDEATALGLPGNWVRSIVYSPDEFDRAIQTLPPSVKVCALLNSETEGVGDDYRNWAPAVIAFARRFKDRVQAVECGNELDVWGVPVSTATRLVVEASDTLRNAGMKVVIGPVAGPNWQDYLQRVARATQGRADWAGLHPYTERAQGYPPGWGLGEIDAAIRRASEISGLPVAVSEFGIKVRDAGSETAQATYVKLANTALSALPPSLLAFASLFCLGDEMGSPGEQGLDGYGLRRVDGTHRPAWQAFADANAGAAPVPAPDPFIVGDGMRGLMTQRGDVPAADELYFKRGKKDEWSECVARSGRMYRYVFSCNEVFTYSPDAA